MTVLHLLCCYWQAIPVNSWVQDICYYGVYTVRVSAHLCHRRVCFQGWVCPAGGRSWWVWFCCGPPVDGPLSSGRSHTAGSRRAADARSDLTGGPLHTHTNTHTVTATGRGKADRKDHYSRHAERCVWIFFNARLRVLTQFMCLLVPGEAVEN